MSDNLPVSPQHLGERYGAPDWVILGMPLGDQVMVFASTELDRAEIEMVRDVIRNQFDRSPYSYLPAPVEIRLKASMRTCRMVVAADYRTALAMLLDQGWSPERRLAITA